MVLCVGIDSKHVQGQLGTIPMTCCWHVEVRFHWLFKPSLSWRCGEDDTPDGITLPFISYGGSSMVTSFALLGLILMYQSNERLVKATDGYEYLDENQDSEQEGFEDENREQELDDGEK